MIKLFLLLLTVYSAPVEALTCVKDYGSTESCLENPNPAGDCSTLGYSTADVDGCEHYLYCPFNTIYKKCVAGGNALNCAELGYTNEDKSEWCSNIITCPNDNSLTACTTESEDVINCAELGYTNEDKSSWCNKIVTCPNDSSLTLCAKVSVAETDCSAYTLSTCPTGVKCLECTNSSGTYYIATNECAESYTFVATVGTCTKTFETCEEAQYYTPTSTEISHCGDPIYGVFNSAGEYLACYVDKCTWSVCETTCENSTQIGCVPDIANGEFCLMVGYQTTTCTFYDKNGVYGQPLHRTQALDGVCEDSFERPDSENSDGSTGSNSGNSESDDDSPNGTSCSGAGCSWNTIPGIDDPCAFSDEGYGTTDNGTGLWQSCL